MNTGLEPDFVARSAEAAQLMRQLGNQQRLLILCHLEEAGELGVGALGGLLALSQSALSQHLARLRNDGLVTARREGQSIRYSVADPRVGTLLATLRQIFCPDL
ncbi:metalloregulator ArsR/SmtB family transcription factor [Sphingomonas sp. ASV193]|uniref:ArsR/SmtB family transcription factor n=1 Tax=Sphingomonas sp. ASV193 TaxID=3144405 RepID=UPI0032E85CD6